MPFHSPAIPFEAMVENHPFCISLEQKSCQLYFSIMHYTRERRHCGRRHWRIGGDGRIRTARPKAQCKGSVNAANVNTLTVFFASQRALSRRVDEWTKAQLLSSGLANAAERARVQAAGAAHAGAWLTALSSPSLVQ